ncbi:MAG TPA: thymidylate synthase (FAD), partial [Oscillospiraceae bacterium]|nr:thymidylate synthase (FAD) [Oscillospiraceae bacterium]
SLFKNAGPSCIRGACPEGRMSCGKAEEVRAFYKELKKEIEG